jgi:hypothetical protein
METVILESTKIAVYTPKGKQLWDDGLFMLKSHLLNI